MNSQSIPARTGHLQCLRKKAIVISSLRTIALASDVLQLPGEHISDDSREGLREVLLRTRKRLERLNRMLEGEIESAR